VQFGNWEHERNIGRDEEDLVNAVKKLAVDKEVRT
jgi:hypothetical protein